jgi:hypothetical protein
MGTLTITHSITVPTSTGEAIENRIAVIEDGTADTIVITTPPSRGRAIPRSDGYITLDLTDEIGTTDITLSYDKTTGGSTIGVDATVTVSEREYIGYSKGLHFKGEIDGTTKDLVFDPGRNHRTIHISTTGFSDTAIIAREPSLSSAPGDWGLWLRDNVADSLSGEYYGETEAAALNFEMGRRLGARLRNDASAGHTSAQMLYKRGDVFAHGLDDGTGAAHIDEFLAESPLHPFRISSYGNALDNPPEFEGKGPKLTNAINAVAGDYAAHDITDVKAGSQNFIIDNVVADFSATDGVEAFRIQGVSQLAEHGTLRRLKARDTHYKTNDGSWGTDERGSAIFISESGHILVEDVFSDASGAARDYRADWDAASPKPPENQSHFIYQTRGNWGHTYNRLISTYASHSIIQWRANGQITDVFGAGSNTGINPSVGLTPTVPSTSYEGNYAIMARYVQTAAGFKSGWTDKLGVIGGSIKNSSRGLSTIDCVVINAGDPNVYTASTDIGPGTTQSLTQSNHFGFVNDTGGPESLLGTLARDEVHQYEWDEANSGNRNLNGGLTANLDAATIGAFTDDLLSASGSTLATFADHLWTLDAPWELSTQLSDFFLDPFNKSVSVPVSGETITFQPDVLGHTPGMRADFYPDWDKKYIPGDTTNNDVDLDGHFVRWNISPVNPIRDLDFGAGGELELHSGVMRPSGTVTVDSAGNDLTLLRGSKFDLASYSSSNLLTVDANQSRFLISGAVTGAVDVTARYESEVVLWDGGDLTIGSGRTLTAYGHSYVGFDGSAGGASALTFATGSTLSVKPTIRVDVNTLTSQTLDVGGVTWNAEYHPRLGSTVTGQTSGATGRVAEFHQLTGNTGVIVLDDINGVFVDTEALNGLTRYGPMLEDARDFANINGTPEYILPTIGEFTTGLTGLDSLNHVVASNVASTVTCAGTVEVDAVGLAAGTYDLVEADTVTGTFGTETITNVGAGLSGAISYPTGKVTLTIS